MPDLPEAKVTVDAEAGASGSGTDILTVMGAVADFDDITPRVFSSTASLLAKHNYAQAVDYCSIHFEEADKPVIFIGLPIATAGSIGSIDQSGNSGTSMMSVAAGSDGVLEEVDATVTVNKGGVVGTDQILLDLSLDGVVTKTIRLGTATSYTIDRVGLVLSVVAGGTLVEGDEVLRFRTTAPMFDIASVALARAALAATQFQSRNWLVVGDIDDDTKAASIVTQINAYNSSHDRASIVRIQARDRRIAKMSKVARKMTGGSLVTFAEVGATGDTITRATGSFVTDGFAVGDLITVAGSVSNNFVDKLITAVSATVLTLDTQDLIAEASVAGVTITGSPALTFAEVGATLDTITRSSGSWVADGFAVGNLITVAGTALNNFAAAAITAVSATVLTLDTQDLVAEVISQRLVTITAEEDNADWKADITDEFETVDDEERIDIAAGRAFKESPITHWKFARGASWGASIREYQKDIQIPTWRKSDGILSGWSLNDASDTKVHHDERVDGGLLLGRFTCFRTYSNGPTGVFIAMSLTRAVDGSLLALTHNMHVVNLASNVTQRETENAIGEVLVLKADGTAEPTSLVAIEERVNSQLAMELLQRKNGNPPRASDAKWIASRSDILNVVDAELTGRLDLRLNGTLVKINTTVRVQTAG